MEWCCRYVYIYIYVYSVGVSCVIVSIAMSVYSRSNTPDISLLEESDECGFIGNRDADILKFTIALNSNLYLLVEPAIIMTDTTLCAIGRTLSGCRDAVTMFAKIECDVVDRGLGIARSYESRAVELVHFTSLDYQQLRALGREVDRLIVDDDIGYGVDLLAIRVIYYLCF